MNIKPAEQEIVGAWRETDNGVEEDAACERIRRLTRERLTEIASTDGGWTTLYQDLEDGRYWKLTYPHSEWPGGGPPKLRVLSKAEVAEKYEGLKAS